MEKQRQPLRSLEADDVPDLFKSDYSLSSPIMRHAFSQQIWDLSMTKRHICIVDFIKRFVLLQNAKTLINFAIKKCP